MNTAVAQLSCELAGEDGWGAICARAEAPRSFIGMSDYPDDLTYRLVGAASDVLDLPAEQVLTAFGRHWVRFTAQEGWGPLLLSAGATLPEVLGGLDDLHARVRLVLPELRPPSFRCRELDASHLVLSYYSDRPGLAPMVVGLVEGLADLLGARATVTHALRAGDDDGTGRAADHDEFLVAHEPTRPLAA